MEFRTDMALERNEMYKQQNKLQQIDGVEIENDRRNDVEISRIKILNETGEKALNKPIGNYITVDVKKIKLADEERLEEIAKIVADELRDTIGEHAKNTGKKSSKFNRDRRKGQSLSKSDYNRLKKVIK